MNEKYSNIAFISIGSNQGERANNLQRAVNELFKDRKLQFLASSSIYETEPLLVAGSIVQPNYLNAVIELKTSLSPEELLNKTQSIETKLGRPFIREKNEPRVIDLDIIFFDNIICSSKRLEIPHPQVEKRHFVLVPLAEIAPNYVSPTSKMNVTDLLKRLDANSVQAYISKHSGPIAPNSERK